MIGAVAAIDLGGDTPETPEEKVCTYTHTEHAHRTIRLAATACVYLATPAVV